MAKVGRFVTDPKAGAYCYVTLDGGEKVIVNHSEGSFKGGLLSVEISKLMGFSSERIFVCDLDTPKGRSIVQWLTKGAEPGSGAATPLGGLVQFVKEAGTLPELRSRCVALMAGH
jgi:hypothetical protein